MLGLTLHPVLPSPIVRLLLLMSIAYLVENIPSNFFSLVGDLCVVISVVQPTCNLLLVPCLPVPLQTGLIIV